LAIAHPENTIKILYFITSENVMLAKRTAKNQVTLPKAIVQAVGDADYYDVSTENGRIILTPVRRKLYKLDITEDDVQDTITWARNQR
jgi:antitoxin component of MazEF toxin-antitoxin module